MALGSLPVPLLKHGKKLAKVCSQLYESYSLILSLFSSLDSLDAARQGTQAGKGRIFQQKGMELEEAKKILGIEALQAPTYDSIMEVRTIPYFSIPICVVMFGFVKYWCLAILVLLLLLFC